MLDFWEENTHRRENGMASQYPSKTKYDKENTKMFGVKLNLKTDADIIAKLESIENKQGYIKALIRADISDGASITKGDVLAKLYAVANALEGLDL